jgi:glycosyltransferase involved in cell wall biosynthesis
LLWAKFYLCALNEISLLILLIVVATAAVLQLIYHTVFFSVFSKRQVAKPAVPVPVSVVVCAHDEEENLKALIPMLLQQEHPEFEVIIVNDRSNDNTYDLLLEETKKDPRLRMVDVKSTPAHVNGKKYGITLGIRAAAHEWIVLTDADCRPASVNWLASMNKEMDEAARFVIGFSPYITTPGFLNAFIRFDSIMTAIQYLSFAALKNPYMGVGRNLAYRKSLFLEKKGFNNFLHLTGGDDDLFVNQHARGRQTRVHVSKESVVYSIPEKTWTDFFYQKVRHYSVGKYYKAKHKFLLGVFMLTWILTLFAGLPLAVFSPYYYAVVGVLILRWLVIILTFHRFTKTTGLRFSLWLVPVLDFLYPIYYISTGLVTLFTRKVRWKK